MSKEPRTCATQQFKRTAVQQEAPVIGYVKRVRQRGASEHKAQSPH